MNPVGASFPSMIALVGHCGAVHEVACVRRLDARLVQDALDDGEKADRGVAGSGRDLRDAGLAGMLVDQDPVGEGAADVHSEAEFGS